MPGKLKRTLELLDMRHGKVKGADGKPLGINIDDIITKRLPLTSLDDPEMMSPPPTADVVNGKVTRDLRETLLIILSGQYGLLVVVVGAVLPIVESFADPNYYMFEGFYIYMYLVSAIFLCYVYAYLLQKQASFMVFKRAFSTLRPSFRRNFSSSQVSSVTRNDSSKSVGGAAGENGAAAATRPRRRKVAYNEQPNIHTGSFYLRIGAVGFGIGSMIYSGLMFGQYFEIVHQRNSCSGVIQAVKPFLHLLFTFVQMYFIFMNSKMCINRNKTFARFGLMHMAATNICVWVRAIVTETLHEIQIANRNKNTSSSAAALLTSYGGGPSTVTPDVHVDSVAVKATRGLLPELKCTWDSVMGRVLEKSTSYLYPCMIEYSLICASVLYVMRDQVGHDPRRRRSQRLPLTESVAEILDPDVAESSATAAASAINITGNNNNNSSSNNNINNNHFLDDEDDYMPASQRMSVDCSGSQRGLFIGLFLLVSAVVSLVVFYVLTNNPGSLSAASILSHVSESLIYIFAIAATAAASWQMKGMRFSRDMATGVEQTLALISLTGLIAFAMFNIVAAMFAPAGPIMAVTLASNFLMIIQSCLQALFMLAAMRVSPANAPDVRRKPGRQWVTFLLVCNFALWVMNTFETQRVEHNLLQVEFYGPTAWNIFCHVSVPLGIYYRFHSTVCFSNIWKNAWKVRRTY